MIALTTIVKLPLVVLGADLLTGIVHWWEDAYGNPKWWILGNCIVKPNIEHHKSPRKFLSHTLFQRIRLSVLVAVVLVSVLVWCGVFRWEYAALLGYASLGNEIHAITHRSDKENGKWIVGLQKLGLIQSRRMHGFHHQSPYNINYCMLTNYLNPLLNRIKCWDIAEGLLTKIGLKTNRHLPERGGY